MAQFTSEAEIYLFQAVREACSRIAHLETEWDNDKLQKKIIEYLGKASKGVSVGISRKPWDQIVKDFSSKFFEAFWRALGDRTWLDEADFTLCVSAAIQAYCPTPELGQVPHDQFLSLVSEQASAAYDECRYYSWGYQALKKVVSGKVSQKKVREAIDNARDTTVKQQHFTVSDFLSNWIAATVQELANAGGNPYTILSQQDAGQLFMVMIQEGGGVPLHLVRNMGGMPPLEALQAEVDAAVSLAYSSYPAVATMAGGKGKFGGFGGPSMYGPASGMGSAGMFGLPWMKGGSPY